MSKYVLEDTEEFLTLPDDVIVQVLVSEVKEREVPARPGHEGWTKLNFRFKVLELPTALEADYAPLIGSTIFGSVSARLTMHPDNKLRQWSEALLGLNLDEPGFELDTDMLVGRKARGVIKTYQKKDSTQRNHEIGSLLPIVTSGLPTSSFILPPARPSNTISNPESSFLSDEPPF